MRRITTRSRRPVACPIVAVILASLRAPSRTRLNLAVSLPLLAAAVSPLCAQFVPDGHTSTLNNVTNTVSGVVSVGTSGPFTGLIFTNGALLTNTAYGAIGLNTGANTNFVLLNGANNRWLMASDLYVGSQGFANRLTLNNGSRVADANGFIADATFSKNNQVIVADPNSVWTNSSDLYVGNSGFLNTLFITNGGTVANGIGYIGWDTTANTNRVTVTGSSSAWNNRGNLYVGYSGYLNTLLITNGALVTNTAYGAIGLNTGANSNSVMLSGASSRWLMASDLYVGSRGFANRLTLNNGSRVADANGIIGDATISKNNQVTVADPNSVWTSSSDLYVGNSGFLNTLSITNGGTVANGIGYIGWDTTANNNQVTVTGANSAWNNRGSLYVGYSGYLNTLLLTNGGAVQAANAHVGFNASSYNNLLSVGSGILTVTNAGGTAALDVRRGSALFNGGTVTADQLLLTNANGAFTFNAGTLVTRAATINNGQDFVVGAIPGLAPATWDVRTNATAATLTGNLIVGSGAANATLLLTNGGQVSASGQIILGGTAASTNNSVRLAGSSLSSVGLTLGGPGSRDNSITLLSNSTWNAGGGLFRWGTAGSGGLLAIDAGSALTNIGSLTLDQNSTAFQFTNAPGGYSFNGFTTNQFRLKTTGLGALVVGQSATSAQLLIDNYTLSTASSIIGSNASAGGNGVTVTGPNSVWNNNTGNLDVGEYGSFNTLLIANGGLVASPYAIIGYAPGANSNQVTVTGPNSVWNNTNGNLLVGASGMFNTLLITNGGAVGSTGGNIGVQVNANNNQVAVKGPNSVWHNSSDLYVGGLGAFNTLLIANGGAVANRFGIIGWKGANNNQVTVTGPNSVWTNSSSVAVGDSGAYNTLLIANGGLVASANAGTIGSGSGANNNQVTVNGPNSVWNNNNGPLYVGDSGAYNTLFITNGGLVASPYGGYIGNNSGANTNQVAVTGTNSVWNNNGGTLYVGNSGAYNTLLITNGGTVADTVGSIGSRTNNNQVTVTGTNSVWNNGSDLVVGDSGSFNTLLITNGGTVANGTGFIGHMGAINQVTVIGPGSAWNNTTNLYVGDAGGGNTLLITNGGTVADSAGYIGWASSADNNQVTVSGPNSVWNNRGDLAVGYSGSFNMLVLANGGAVQASHAYVGFFGGSGNSLSVGNSTLTVTNAGGTAALDVRKGSAVLNGGTISADQLLLTNANGTFTFNAGTLNVRAATVSNSVAFTVGNGTGNATLNLIGGGTRTFANQLVISPNAAMSFAAGVLNSANTLNNNGKLFAVGDGLGAATFNLTGNGTHSFPSGLVVSNNATLSGNGTVSGLLTVRSGGTLSPGASVGRIILNNSPALQGQVLLEISKNGATLTNDQVQVTVGLNYGGSLAVRKLGPTALAAGDTFQLFSATSYGGAFTNLNLPVLDPGLVWTNKLLVNGSIAVVAGNNTEFSSTTLAGTNLILGVIGGLPGGAWNLLTTTNVALPVANWITNSSGLFDGLGSVTLTNGINPAEPQRYFRIRTP